jgi:hypothetical protein
VNGDWKLVTDLEQTKLSFTGRSGPQKPASNVLDVFLLFFDKKRDFIFLETVDTTAGLQLKPRSQSSNW